ncbi:unnamed protein product [Lactuca virosa]|uniref:Alcohol dehydrogenase N-terminal domain-containing protein n=1 Tax=Lactuca virosa TaxID=75947 RepID=A0AAU9M2Y5_9ASTR|nr:unnamed protein product [Lactuca virosa]
MDMDMDVSLSLVMHISYRKASITKKKVNIVSHFRSLNMLVQETELGDVEIWNRVKREGMTSGLEFSGVINERREIIKVDKGDKIEVIVRTPLIHSNKPSISLGLAYVSCSNEPVHESLWANYGPTWPVGNIAGLIEPKHIFQPEESLCNFYQVTFLQSMYA